MSQCGVLHVLIVADLITDARRNTDRRLALGWALMDLFGWAPVIGPLPEIDLHAWPDGPRSQLTA